MIFLLGEKACAETWCRQPGGCNRMLARLLNTQFVFFSQEYVSVIILWPQASLLLSVIPTPTKVWCHGLSVLFPSIQGLV